MQRKVHAALLAAPAGNASPHVLGLLSLWDAKWPGLQDSDDAARAVIASPAFQHLWLRAGVLASWRYLLIDEYWYYLSCRAAAPSTLQALLSTLQSPKTIEGPALLFLLRLLYHGDPEEDYQPLMDPPPEFEALLTARGRAALEPELSHPVRLARCVRSGVQALYEYM